MSVLREVVTRSRALVVGGGGGTRTSVFGQGAGNAMLNLAALVLNFATTLILSRLLGADGYGAYAFAFALVVLLSVPAVLGLTPLLVREITSYRMNASWGAVRGLQRRANESVAFTSLVVCAAAVAVSLVTGWPHGRFHLPSLYVLPLVPLIAVTSVRQGVMQGFGRVFLGRAPETAIMPAVLVVGAGILGVALGPRFTASWAVGVADAAGVVALLVGIVFLRRVLPAEARSAQPTYESRRWARAALPLVAFSIVSTAGTQLPTVLLGALTNPHEVGVYNVAARIAGVLPFLLIAIAPAMMPAIAELDVLGRHQELQQLMTRSARLILSVSVPIALVALLFAAPLLRIFGSGFAGGETPLRILALGQLLNIVCGLPGTVLVMSGDAAAMTATFATTTTLTLALTAALAPRWGASGAAIANAAGVAASNVVLTVVLWRRRRIYAPAVFVRLCGSRR